MNEGVTDIIEGVLTATSSDVAILVTVALHAAINTGTKAEAAEVKLALMDEQGIVNVLLNDEGAVSIFFHRSTNYLLDLLDGLDHCDALATVGVLAWLDDPGVLGGAELATNLLDGVLIVSVHLATIVFVLSITLLRLLFFFLVCVILLDSSLSLCLSLLGLLC